MTLFDIEPLSPADAIRVKGYHPITRLPLDPDQGRTCGNCANRRWVWNEADGEWYDTVCNAAGRPCKHHPSSNIAVWPAPDPQNYCDDFCCTAEEPHGAEWVGIARPWPWDETTEPWMPACSAWIDLEAEQVVATLAET